MPRRRERRACPLILVVVDGLATVVDRVFVDHEATLLVDRLYCVRLDSPTALRAAARLVIVLDVLVEAVLVDLSRSHSDHEESGERVVPPTPSPL